MIAFLSEWLKKLILLVIIAALIDLFLPNSNIQKYARMVIGLLIILTLLTPILTLLNMNNFSSLISQNAFSFQQGKALKDGATSVEQMAANLNRVNQQSIISKIKQNLEQEIAFTIRNVYETDATVDVQLKVNNKMEANIDKIVVYLQGRVHKKDNEDNLFDESETIPSIPAVEIQIGEEKEDVEQFSTENRREREKTIRNYLISNYHLQMEQVEILDQSSRRNP